MSEIDPVGYVKLAIGNVETRLAEVKEFLVEETERTWALEKKVEEVVLEELADDHTDATAAALFLLLSRAAQERVRRSLQEAGRLPEGWSPT